MSAVMTKDQEWLQKLAEHRVKHKITSFSEELFTCDQVAQITGLDQNAIGKAMVIGVDKGFAVALLPGPSRLNLNAVKALLKAKKVYLATPQQIEQQTRLKVGAVSPLVIFDKPDLPLIADESLKNHSMINISSGDHTYGISISPEDLFGLIKPILGQICKP